MDILAETLALAHNLGRPEADQAILAEGNVSARLDDKTFLVKASGFHMGTLEAHQLCAVRFAPILEAYSLESLADADVKALLARSRVHDEGPILPSVETFFHAFALSLPGVAFVGHTHLTPLVSLLSLRIAPELAVKRLFPDEVVCCGPASAFVPYVDPGLPLAKAIRDSVLAFQENFGEIPKTIWLQNHGLIALGETPGQVRSAMEMSAKAARVWLGALSTGLEIVPLAPEQVARIHGRPDEHYRQRLLWAQQP